MKDYGIWERGDKTNNGQPELNASSIGMAKVRTKIFSAYLSKFQIIYYKNLWDTCFTLFVGLFVGSRFA